MMALDFGDQYWGDIGQHRQMYELYMALRDPGPAGRIARALAGLCEGFDAQGNVIAGNTRLGPGVKVRGSVLIDAVIDSGEVVDSVLIGTRCGQLRAREAFDIRSTVPAMELGRRAGAYKVVADTPVTAAASERIATVFLPDQALLMRVGEGTDLRDKATSYDVPISGNPMAFGRAHAVVTQADPARLQAVRQAARERVRAQIDHA